MRVNPVLTIGGLKSRIAAHYGIEVVDIAIIHNDTRYETQRSKKAGHHQITQPLSTNQSNVIKRTKNSNNATVSRTPSPKTAKLKAQHYRGKSGGKMFAQPQNLKNGPQISSVNSSLIEE